MPLRTLIVMTVAAALLLAGCEDAAVRFNQQGLVAYRAGEYRQALAAFEEAVAANPDAGDYYFNCAMAEQALGNLDRAVFLYDMATKLKPSIIQAYQNMAQCHLQKQSPKRALDALVSGTRFNPYTGEAFINVARYYLDSGDLDMAELWLAKGVAADPENPRAHREYALLLIRMGNRQKGIEHLRRSLELVPAQPEVSATLTELAPSGPQLPPPEPETE